MAEEVDGPAITLNQLVTLRCQDASKHPLSMLSAHSFRQMIPLPPWTTSLQLLARIDSLRLTTTTGVAYSGQTMDTRKFELMEWDGSLVCGI